MPERQILRLLILGQLFTLLFLLLTPHLLRWLVFPWGKALYAVLGLLAVAQTLALHQALRRLE